MGPVHNQLTSDAQVVASIQSTEGYGFKVGILDRTSKGLNGSGFLLVT